VRGSTELRELLPAFTPSASHPEALASRASRYRTTRGVRWAVRLLRIDPARECLARSLALYAALRDQGWAVSFVSGVPVGEGRPATHTWLELDGRVLPELREPANAELYRENFRYP
jgi:hypothetical protein